MGEVIFIVGGARSGKSNFAEKLAEEQSKHLLYLATGEPKDNEMKKRIEKHKKRRGRKWKLIEAPIELAKALSTIKSDIDVVLIDCITLWISNLLLSGKTVSIIKKDIAKMIAVLERKSFTTILVSNDVGCGIVPGDPLSRKYRDVLGLANQLIAGSADTVYNMCCGIANKIK